MIISILADQGLSTSRFFYGNGATNGSGNLSTISAGNGKYNAPFHGWVISAQLNAAGTGYSVGDTYSIGLCTITIDAVGASGAIVDFHVSAYGNYSGTAYPANPAGTGSISGSGTGATFNLNWPQPDFYVDMTSPTSPVLYICTTAGSATTSVWAKISGAGSGGGTYAGTYVNANAYSVGQIVRVQSTTTVGGVTPTLGVFGCVAAVPALGSGNQVPQYPEPTSGTVYWHLLAFGPQETGECNGSSGNLYVNASAPF
jgi:hypothetical protein